MKLKNLYKYYLLLIFLNCHENRNCKPTHEKRRNIQILNFNHPKKLQCNCPHRYAPQATTTTLCPNKQETRPANLIKSRLKLQGRKPKFKFATSKKFNTNRAQMQHANDNEIDNDDDNGDDGGDAWIEHLTAKVASGSGSDSDRGSDCDCGCDSGSSSDVGNYLRQQLNGERDNRPAIDTRLNI